MTEHRFGRRDPDARGYYGAFGGKFVPETLVAPVEELEQAYLAARNEPNFLAELDRLLARLDEREPALSLGGGIRVRTYEPEH